MLMNMSIKPIKQEAEKNCTSACLRMVLSFYGCDATMGEVDTFVTKDNEGYTFETEIARFAQYQGFDVDCYAYNLYLTDPKDASLSPDRLVQKLEQQRTDPRFDPWYELKLQSTIRCIRDSVHYLIVRPTLRVILSYLRRRIPLIVTVNPSALYGRQGLPHIGHDIVLFGYEASGASAGNYEGEGGRILHFIDPATGTRATTSCDSLMFALLARGITALSGYMLAIMR